MNNSGKIFLSTLTALFILLAASCAKKHVPDTTHPSQTSQNTINSTTADRTQGTIKTGHQKLIRMKTEKEVYPIGVEYINLVIESDSEFGFDTYFEVEKKNEGAWVKLPLNLNAASQDIFYTVDLNPDTNTARTNTMIELNYLQDKLTSGSYRIIKKIENQTVYAEFKVA